MRRGACASYSIYLTTNKLYFLENQALHYCLLICEMESSEILLLHIYTNILYLWYKSQAHTL